MTQISLLLLAAAPGAVAAQGGDQKNLVLWGLLCIGVAVVLLIMELFIPSSMVLGSAAMVSLVTGIVLLFIESQTLGLFAALVSLVAMPIFFGIAVRVWPQTPIARLLTLSAAHTDDAPTLDDDSTPGVMAGLSVAVGATGRAVTDLRPVGVVMIDGHRADCLADGGVIRAGAAVKVVSVDGMQVKVREEV